jgi:hypothetical protein
MISLFIYNFLTYTLFKIYKLLSNTNLYILNDDKINKSYRIVNLTKSICLGLASPYAFYLLYCIINTIKYNIYILYFISSLYAALDASALLYNENMHITTTIHHIVVQIFYYYGTYIDWNVNSLSNLILIYAIFSSFAYLVNMRLAIRKLDISNSIILVINDISLFIYFTSCIFNWTLQIFYVYKTNFLEPMYLILLYLLFIFLIAFDDIKLIKYLYSKSNYIKKIIKY